MKNLNQSRVSRTGIFTTTLAACVLLGFGAQNAAAQTYPSQPVQIVVPTPPGGVFDVSARLLATEMAKHLPTPVLIDNRPGAAALLGPDFVAKSKPDGYRICLCSSGAITLSGLVSPQPNYDPLEDLSPVSLSFWLSLMMVARKDLPVNTVQELLAYTKANKGKVTMGYAGGAGLLAIALVKSVVGLDVTEVPYQGETPGLTNVAGGQIDLFPASVIGALPVLNTGAIKPIATLTSQRAGKLPNVRTVAEQGFPGFGVDTFVGLNVPRGTPQPIIQKLAELASAAAKEPSLRSRFDDLGLVPAGTGPEEYGKIMREERAKWTKLVKDLGIQPPK